jgi:hypothetical protein
MPEQPPTPARTGDARPGIHPLHLAPNTSGDGPERAGGQRPHPRRLAAAPPVSARWRPVMSLSATRIAGRGGTGCAVMAFLAHATATKGATCTRKAGRVASPPAPRPRPRIAGAGERCKGAARRLIRHPWPGSSGAGQAPGGIACDRAVWRGGRRRSLAGGEGGRGEPRGQRSARRERGGEGGQRAARSRRRNLPQGPDAIAAGKPPAGLIWRRAGGILGA